MPTSRMVLISLVTERAARYPAFNSLASLSRRLDGRWPCIADMIVLLSALAAMVAINPEWLFSWKNLVDDWMYVGYFWHYDTPGFLADNKKIARLPWILLGYLVNKVANPITASLILHTGLLAAGALAFYRLAAKLFGRPSAILAAFAYMTSQSIHGSAASGWDYHNTLEPVLYFLSFSLLDSAVT